MSNYLLNSEGYWKFLPKNKNTANSMVSWLKVFDVFDMVPVRTRFEIGDCQILAMQAC